MTRGLFAYFLFDLGAFWREPMAIIFTFIIPAFFFILSAFNGGIRPEQFVAGYSPSFVGVIIITTALFTIGPGLVLGRELGFYKRLLATPMDTSVILIATVLRSYVVVAGGLIQMLVLSYWVLGHPPSFNVLEFLLALTISCASIFTAGVFLGSFFKSSRTSFSVSVILLQPLLFLSGATLPISKLPGGMKESTNLIPTRHMVDLLRLGWDGRLFERAALEPVLVLLGMMIVLGVASRYLFRWTSR